MGKYQYCTLIAPEVQSHLHLKFLFRFLITSAKLHISHFSQLLICFLVVVVVSGAIQSGSWKLHAFNVFVFVFFVLFFLFTFIPLYPLPPPPPYHHHHLLLFLTSPFHHCDCCLGNLLRQPHQAFVPSVLIGPTC